MTSASMPLACSVRSALKGHGEKRDSFYSNEAVDDHEDVESRTRGLVASTDLFVDENVDEDDENVDEDDDREVREISTEDPKTLSGFCREFLVKYFILVGMLLCIVLIGAAVEGRKIRRSPLSETLYEGTSVCALNSTNPTNPSFQTFPSYVEAHREKFLVSHCGTCRACSTATDLFILSGPSGPLFQQQAACAWRILGGRRAVNTCLRKKFGHTEGCQPCWNEYVKCFTRNCKFTCLFSGIFRTDTCESCKERVCGKDLLSCSGVNRKNLGFFGKNDENVCEVVDFWWHPG